MNKSSDNIVIGWREWVSLPELGIRHVKAKVDTGARTSALHAFALETFTQDGKLKVRFDIHPIQYNLDEIVSCVADVKDQRMVTDSGGHREERYVIETPVRLADYIWPVEITLTNRDTMNFRMLLGRTALRHRFVVNPAVSFMIKRKKALL